MHERIKRSVLKVNRRTRLFLLLVILLAPLSLYSKVQHPPPLELVQSIPLPGVKGRIDHMAVDLEGKRLFVAALGNNTLEVIDLSQGKRIHTIGGFHEPQGVLYLPELRTLYVTNGGDGTCMILDGGDLHRKATLRFSGDADNMRYDPATKTVYVGYGEGALGVIDARSLGHRADIQLDGHPESFVLAQSGAKIYVNVPAAGHVAVIDRESRSVQALWPLKGAKGNFPMALDDKENRLFIGCRQPPKILVLDALSGQTTATLDTEYDLDDIYYDAVSGRVYASGGGGVLSVFQKDKAGHYAALARIPTPQGARTSLFIKELGRLYLAVPASRGRQAEIRIYQATS
ncbi:MAG: YncE family protein [Thermodesulfovibrionales bacterium]